MKRRNLLVILMILGVSFFGWANAKSRVAVLNFSARGVEEYLADAVVENLITSLIDSGVYEVIERNQLRLLMDELKLQNSDDFNDELRKELGNLYEVELVILGSVTMIGDNITINVRGVEVDTGVARFAKNFITNSENDIPYLIPLLVDIISGKKKNGISENSRNEELVDHTEQERAEENLIHKGKVELAQFRVRDDWEMETVKFSKGNRGEYRAILVSVEGSCVELAYIRVYTEDEKYSISDNIILDEDNRFSYVVKIENRDGSPAVVEKVKVGFRYGDCKVEKGTKLTIWGVN